MPKAARLVMSKLGAVFTPDGLRGNFPALQLATYTVRRATLDDLPVLKGLWDTARLPTLELERHLTEFQMIERPDGAVVGAAGLRIVGLHALVHSEAFHSAQQADELRRAFWERCQTLARSHGVARVWVKGRAARSWTAAGFRAATEVELKRLPPVFGLPSADWHTLQIRDEAAITAALNREYAELKAEGQAESERLRRHGQVFKWLATSIAIAFFLGAIWLLTLLLRHRPWIPHP